MKFICWIEIYFKHQKEISANSSVLIDMIKFIMPLLNLIPLWVLVNPCTVQTAASTLFTFLLWCCLTCSFPSLGRVKVEPQWQSCWTGSPPVRGTCLFATTESLGCLYMYTQHINTHTHFKLMHKDCTKTSKSGQQTHTDKSRKRKRATLFWLQG